MEFGIAPAPKRPEGADRAQVALGFPEGDEAGTIAIGSLRIWRGKRSRRSDAVSPETRLGSPVGEGREGD